MTALKTISARIRGSKSDLEELGEDTEELANGFSKYAEELKAITGVNIMVEGTTDQFKDLYDIMNDIAGVWDTLTDTQQARAAEILGGTRQLQVIASIISNWGDAEHALVDAQNAVGEATRANDIYMDTTTAHMNQFKSAFQDLSRTMIDSDMLKWVVDFGTGLLKAINAIGKFINSLGGIVPILTTIAGVVMLLNPMLLTTVIGKIGVAISGLFTAITTGAATAGTALTAVSGGLGVVLVAASALYAAINGVNNAHKQARDAAIQAGTAAADEGDELSDLAQKYLELAKVSSDSQATLDARDAVINKLGLEQTEVRKLVNEYGSYEEAVRHATLEQLKDQRLLLQSAYKAAQESLTGNGYQKAGQVRSVGYDAGEADSNKHAFNNLKKAGYVSSYDAESANATFQMDLGDMSSYEGVLDAYGRIHNALQLLMQDGLANTAVYDDLSALYVEMQGAVDTYNGALNDLIANELQQQYLQSGIPQTASEYDSLRNSLIQAVAGAKDFNVGMDSATDAVDNFLANQPALSEFANAGSAAFSALGDAASSLSDIHNGFKEVSSVFGEVTQSLKDVNSLQALVADGFAVDVEQAMALAEAYPQILDAATITADGQLLLNEETVNSFIEGKKGEINAAIDAKIAELEADKATLLAKKELAQAQLEMAEAVARGESQLSVDQLQNRIDNQNKVTEALVKMGISEADAYKAVYEAMSTNASIFDGNVADVAENIAADMSSAASSMATSFNANTKLMNNGMGILVGNAHQVAEAINAMGSGKVSGAIGYTDGGGNGQSINTFNKSFNATKFNGVSVGYKSTGVQLKNLITDLKTDISSYTKAISAIDGQIAALNAARNNALSGINNYKPSGSGKGGSGGGGNGGGGGSGSGSSDKEENWFEKLYKQHQHYVNMDKETQADFIKWLEKAYKQAYKEGIITLDEYYKYEEEIYKAYQSIKDAAKSTFDELVEYRVKMLKQDRENQKDALNDQLKDLKNFYDKQKQLLQDQQAEEKYLEEQTERRKTVNDIKAQLQQLQFDTSAWAQKRRAELTKELADAEKDLADYENEHAVEQALNALDDAYNHEEEQLQKQIDAIDDVLNDPDAFYNQALKDIKGNTNDLFKAFLLFNKKYGDGKDETIIKMWEEAFKNSEAYKSIYGSYYENAKIGNYTGVKLPTADTSVKGTGNKTSTSKTSSSSSSSSSKKSSAPSLASGSTIQVKPTATNFSAKSGGVRMASFVPGGQYTVYQTSGNEVLIGRNGVYTGWINKSDIVGYKSGTKNAKAGLHRVNEEGAEAVFTSSDGATYRMFSGGEKVLPAKATGFLYEFAMAGAEILDKLKGSAADTFANRGVINQPITVTMGDIIINGDAAQATVSEVRRAQREQVNDVLKAFGRFQTTLYRNTK